MKSLSIPDLCGSIFSASVKSSQKIPNIGRAIKRKCGSALEISQKVKLDSLIVQSKFRDIIDLEPECKVLNRVTAGLLSGQLSFILRANSE